MHPKYRLAEIAQIRPGYLARQTVKSSATGTHYLLQVRDFDHERTALNSTSLIRFSPEPVSSAQPIQPGEILFLARGAKNFACALTDLPTPALAASYFFVIRPKAHVLPAFLAWSLNQPPTLRALSRSATSGHMPVIRRADIENILVTVPPLPLQRAIVELDNLMREEQSLLQELAKKKKELISSVCMAAAQSGTRTGATS